MTGALSGDIYDLGRLFQILMVTDVCERAVFIWKAPLALPHYAKDRDACLYCDDDDSLTVKSICARCIRKKKFLIQDDAGNLSIFKSCCVH